MADLSSFSPPANQQDFPKGSTQQELLDTIWNDYVNSFVQQGITGNPRTSMYAADQTSYFQIPW